MAVSRRFMQTVAAALAKSEDPGHREIVKAMERVAGRLEDSVPVDAEELKRSETEGGEEPCRES